MCCEFVCSLVSIAGPGGETSRVKCACASRAVGSDYAAMGVGEREGEAGTVLVAADDVDDATEQGLGRAGTMPAAGRRLILLRADFGLE